MSGAEKGDQPFVHLYLCSENLRISSRCLTQFVLCSNLIVKFLVLLVRKNSLSFQKDSGNLIKHSSFAIEPSNLMLEHQQGSSLFEKEIIPLSSGEG